MVQCGAVCGAVYCSVLQCVAVYCSVLQCVTVCCSVLQCGVMCPPEHSGNAGGFTHIRVKGIYLTRICGGYTLHVYVECGWLYTYTCKGYIPYTYMWGVYLTRICGMRVALHIYV